MEEKKITINGLGINYKIFAKDLSFEAFLPSKVLTKEEAKEESKIILILHGWGIGSDSWTAVAQKLASKNFKVVIPDMPGFGKSEAPKTAWDFDNYIVWIENFAKDLELKKFFLAGHSFGGALSVKFAALHPETVEKLVLCDAAVMRRQRLGLRQKIAKLLAKTKSPAQKIPFGIYPILRKIAYRIGGSKDYAMAQGVMAEIFKNVVNYDTMEYAQKITVPTLIVWGSKDKETPLDDAYAINQAVRGSKLEIVKGAGHKIHRTHSCELSDIICDFLIK